MLDSFLAARFVMCRYCHPYSSSEDRLLSRKLPACYLACYYCNKTTLVFGFDQFQLPIDAKSFFKLFLRFYSPKNTGKV